MKKGRSQLLNIIVISMTLFACNQGQPYKTEYSKFTYKDFEEYNYYTTYGYPISYAPSVGTTKLLVIPIWFNDSTNYIALDHRENVRDDIRKAYFGSEEETGWESVSTYYAKDSFGRVNIEGTVTEWYETGYNSSVFYSSYDSTDTLLREVGKWAKSNVSDYSSYDTDKDGYIDGLCLIYGCYDYYGLYYSGVQYDCSNMWAYTSYLAERNQGSLRSPGVNSYFWASYDFMYGQYEGDKEFNASRTGKGDFGNGDTSHCIIDSHTFVHETGHLFGLDDYYDYNGVSVPALGFSMQDHNVGAHDPFSRYALGWAKAIVPTETCRVRVKPMEEGGEFILLSPNYVGSAFSEYIAIELFTKTGVNKADCEHTYDGRPHPTIDYGVRIWHVDARLFKVRGINYYGYPSKGFVTDDMTVGDVTLANSNTTYDGNKYGRASNLGGSYDYRELKVIRRGYGMYDENGNKIEETFQRSPYITNEDFFVTGDTFTMHDYRSQFVEDEMLNGKVELGWEVYFEEVGIDGMTVVLTKTN